MKSFFIAIIAVIFATLVVAEEEDLLSKSIDKCLNKLGLGDAENLDEQQTYCLNGCLLQEYQLIGQDGKLLSNGTENFLKNLPEQYIKEYPELKSELNEIAPELLEAEDACDAGEIAEDVIGDLFGTEFSE